MVVAETTPSVAADLARECLYRFLAGAISDPRTTRWPLVLDLQSRQLASAAAELLREEAEAAPVRLGFGELPPEALTLQGACDSLPDSVEALQAEYDRVFGLVPARECPPYETEYHATSEPFFQSQQMADVAGFYRAFGLQPTLVLPERPDHLGLELEFMAFLLLKKRLASEDVEQVRVCEEAERDFFREHLAWWVPSFATGLRRRAAPGVYAALGEVLAAFLPAERRRLGVDTPSAPVQPAARRPEEPSGCAGCGG